MLIDVISIIKNDLKDVEDIIKKSLENNKNQFAKELIDYLLNAKGKMLRPILTLLVFYSLTPEPSKKQINKILTVSAAIEIIHMASLVHDDVIDDGEVRRMKKTINKKWGNEVAVVLGVYLYSVALKLIADVGSLDILSYLSNAVFSMCNGELIQLDNRNSNTFDEEKYLSIISAKTADLFISSSLCASSIANCSQHEVESVRKFAFQLGQLFQFTDDYLDLKDSNGLLKKEQFQDLTKGTYTLPFKFILDLSTDDEKNVFLNFDKSNKENFVNLLKSKTASKTFTDQCNEIKNEYVKTAFIELDSFEPNKYIKALKKLTSIVAARVH
tara:strand:- start:5040 stop:6023 length:984 start_codon:yes stop_codon:yes gene_type:complete